MIAIAETDRGAGLLQGDARFAATVDLPTPPLPLAIGDHVLDAVDLRRADRRAAAAAARAAPGYRSARSRSARRQCRAARLRLVLDRLRHRRVVRRQGQLHDAHRRPLTCDALTSPNETMSRLNPGYFTVLSDFLDLFSETGMEREVTARAPE